MATSTLEKRVKTLEQEVAQLKAVVNRGLPTKDWRRTVGMFTGDEVMKRIDEGARRFREADRARVRRPSHRP
jgi:hypothetical protein